MSKKVIICAAVMSLLVCSGWQSKPKEKEGVALKGFFYEALIDKAVSAIEQKNAEMMKVAEEQIVVEKTVENEDIVVHHETVTEIAAVVEVIEQVLNETSETSIEEIIEILESEDVFSDEAVAAENLEGTVGTEETAEDDTPVIEEQPETDEVNDGIVDEEIDDKPVVEEEQTAEDIPVVEDSAIEEMPVENEVVKEETSVEEPAIEDTPVIEEQPVENETVEQEQIVEETDEVQDEAVEEEVVEESVVEKEQAVEDIPSVEEPVIEEKLPVENAAVEETEEPVVEDTTVVEQVPETKAVEDVPEEKEIVDITDKLNGLMWKNKKYLENFKAKYGCVAAALVYYLKVTDGGDWDIKLTNEWKFEKDKVYVYRGKEMRMDDPGNIHFGYLGAILFPEEFVCFGAGFNNFMKFGFRDGNIHSYFDDPQDQQMMRWGYSLYVSGQ